MILEKAFVSKYKFLPRDACAHTTMTDAQLHAIIIGMTERLLLLLGWDRTEAPRKKKDEAYTNLKKAIRKTNTKQMFETPTLKPPKVCGNTVSVSAPRSEWTDNGSTAFDAAVTGTV